MSFGQFNREWIAAMQTERDRILARGALAKVEAFVLEHRAHKTPVLPYPLIFDQREYDRLVSAGRAIVSAQSKILRHLCATRSRAEILEMFDAPQAMAPFVDWDELVEGKYAIARFDIIPSRESFYFCELNSDSSVSGFEMFDCFKLYADTMDWPLAEGQHAPHEDIVRLIKRAVEEKGLDRVAICDWSKYRNLGYFGFDILHRYVQRALPGLDVRLVYENSYPQDWLEPDMGRRTLVYRGFMYPDMDDGGVFFGRLWDSGATIINTFETEIRTNKGWFAMFFEPKYRHLLNADELLATERHVPRTFALNALNLPLALRRKSEYVFKLDRSSGGEGVLMGAEHTADELRTAMAVRGIEHWTAQQLIPFEGLDLPRGAAFEMSRHNLVFGLYLIDGTASGVLVRASNVSKVVNVTRDVAASVWSAPMTPAARADQLARIRAGSYASGEVVAR
jgi:hypothetical protein